MHIEKEVPHNSRVGDVQKISQRRRPLTKDKRKRKRRSQLYGPVVTMLNRLGCSDAVAGLGTGILREYTRF